MKQKQLLRHTERRLGMTEGMLCPVLCMEFTANRQVIAEGCRRVSEYDQNRIVLDTVEGAVAFEGDALCINALGGGKAQISGRILTVSFID